MNILFVSSTHIGDAVLTTGLLNHLYENFPDARFTVACGAVPAPLFSYAPGVQRVIPVIKRRFAAHWLGLWSEVIGTKWDLVVDLRGSALSWLLSTRERRVLRRADEAVHRVESLGIFFKLDKPPSPCLWWSEKEDEFAKKTISEGPAVIALGPSANWPPKIWPAERFIELIDRLTGTNGVYGGARIAVFGNIAEREQVGPILNAIPSDRCIDLVGRTDLLTTAACLKYCSLFVGNDSGLMHLSAATGTHTVGLFGPTDPRHYAPWGPNCAVATSKVWTTDAIKNPGLEQQSAESLMTGLSVDKVIQAIEQLSYRCRTT